MPTVREWNRLRRATPARLGVGRAGAHYTTASWLQFRADHARATDAVRTEVSADWPRRHRMVEVRSCAASREEFLLKPDLGRRVCPGDIQRLHSGTGSSQAGSLCHILIIVGDGLSSAAVEANAAPLMRGIIAELSEGTTRKSQA